MSTPNYIGVVYDGRSVGGSYLYRVNYGTFAIPLESPAPLTIDECRERADAILSATPTRTSEPPVPTPTVPTEFTKLQIRRAMRRLGIESQLDGLLAISTMFASDWADALTIDLSDPVLLSALSMAQIDVDAIIAEVRRG